MGPFEIEKELVRHLDDRQLRSLLERLLLAEATARGISHFGIAVGGNQIAASMVRSNGTLRRTQATGCPGA
jgi:hypothetical protein